MAKMISTGIMLTNGLLGLTGGSANAKRVKIGIMLPAPWCAIAAPLSGGRAARAHQRSGCVAGAQLSADELLNTGHRYPQGRALLAHADQCSGCAQGPVSG